jgi:hypothetical protein
VEKERGRRHMSGRLTEGRGIIFLEGSLGFAGSEFEFYSRGRIIMGGTGLLGVLGTGARISIWYPGARKLS